MASAKIGGYHYFSRSLGIRYYYNYDISLNPKLRQSGDIIFAINSENVASIFKYHTLNFDVIFNAYSSSKVDFALLGGIGAGLRFGRTITKNGDHLYLPGIAVAMSSVDTTYARSSIMRINLGMRTQIDQRYGVELLAHFIPNPSVIYNLGTRKISLSSAYYWTLNFVMEL